ncbi:hypothetical protein MTQ86_24320 [Escherichia coli]|nr:hypothetical protein [Escherichia coli]MCT6233017.1 hypothetical protein [Escherichia coli]
MALSHTASRVAEM